MQTLTKRKESIVKQLSKSDSLFFLLEVEHLFPEEREVVSFLGKTKGLRRGGEGGEAPSEDQERVRAFNAIASRYYPSKGLRPLGAPATRNLSPNGGGLKGGGAPFWRSPPCDCGGTIEQNNDYYVCDTCCKISTIIENSDRSPNRTSNYDRKTKFRECISRYQARQDVLIDKRPYEKYLLRHYGDLSEVTKKQIFHMLINLGKENQVKHIHLIHYEITGVPPNNIDYLEESLMHDFEVLMRLYDDKKRGASPLRSPLKPPQETGVKGAEPPQGVVSIRQVFYHLMKKNGVACCKEEFGIRREDAQKGLQRFV